MVCAVFSVFLWKGATGNWCAINHTCYKPHLLVAAGLSFRIFMPL